MKKNKTAKIDFSEARLARTADKYYNDGKYLAALRLANKQYETYGGDEEVFARLSDIYEGMGLHASAINWWFRLLDIAEDEDLADIYEGLAVNYLNLGNETQAAYYYNRLLDADETIPDEMKMEIVDAFSKDKKEKFRFTYPPRLADYSKEISIGSQALKSGRCKQALEVLSVVEKGSKDYAEAMEMQAVAQLLSGNEAEAERLCKTLLEDIPDDTRTLATLSAVYLEQGRAQDSLEIALRLYAQTQTDADELYKVATVCCENGLHAQAYEKFCQLEEKMPYDGRMLYFKAVAAYKSGDLKAAQTTFDTLCTIYPDAEVAKYYLKNLRLAENGDVRDLPEPTYFYHVPKEEREERCKFLMHIEKCPQDEAQLFGLLALHDGYFQWCFDEMDGADHELQYLGLRAAVHVRADEFVREMLLDCEVADMLKIETLRMLYERNEEEEYGLTLCHLYRRVYTLPVRLGRKKRKIFLAAYAAVASKFTVVSEAYGGRIQRAAEKLYAALEERQSLDRVEKEETLAAAIFVLAGLRELGRELDSIAAVFGTTGETVRELLVAAGREEYAVFEKTKENGNETD